MRCAPLINRPLPHLLQASASKNLRERRILQCLSNRVPCTILAVCKEEPKAEADQEQKASHGAARGRSRVQVLMNERKVIAAASTG